jgi:hypothetical protein
MNHVAPMCVLLVTATLGSGCSCSAARGQAPTKDEISAVLAAIVSSARSDEVPIDGWLDESRFTLASITEASLQMMNLRDDLARCPRILYQGNCVVAGPVTSYAQLGAVLTLMLLVPSRHIGVPSEFARPEIFRAAWTLLQTRDLECRAEAICAALTGRRDSFVAAWIALAAEPLQIRRPAYSTTLRWSRDTLTRTDVIGLAVVFSDAGVATATQQEHCPPR